MSCSTCYDWVCSRDDITDLHSQVCDSGIIHRVMNQISVISSCIFCSLCKLSLSHHSNSLSDGHYFIPSRDYVPRSYISSSIPPTSACTFHVMLAGIQDAFPHVRCLICLGITPSCEGCEGDQLRCHSQCLLRFPSSTYSFFQATLLSRLVWKQRCVYSCTTLTMVGVQYIQLSPEMCS